MANQDVEFFQSFLRKYINKAVKNHFRDVPGENDASLSTGVARQAIKRVCLHKDTDTLVLSVGRLLVWWVEARGLLDEYLYSIPSTDFEISNTYYPQVKLHFLEDKYEASKKGKRPIRSEVSFRWREEDFSEAKINSLATKVHADFAKPIFFFNRGIECWTYWDKRKGYRFTVYTTNETQAKKIIEQTIAIQDEDLPDWEKNLRRHESKINYNIQEKIKVRGETFKKPRQRPIGVVQYQYAELFIPGTTKPIILSDITGYKPQAIKYN